ncbi:MAG: type II toxin-antitoxin system RelE/ParE family toxin [bacterium]|nr:type II toxin-antitoxin system RelE/ParE family toxin [bacterium]
MASVPRPDFQRIKKVISEMAQNPFMGDLQKLGGKETEWRRRIGAYRIIFELSIAEHCLFITDIRRRASNTY